MKRALLVVIKDLDDIWVFGFAQFLNCANLIINVVFGDISKQPDYFPRKRLPLVYSKHERRGQKEGYHSSLGVK
jgi:hypothetical protein